MHYNTFNSQFQEETAKEYNEGDFVINEAHTKEFSFTGNATVNSGNYKYTYTATPLTDAPLRAEIKIGLQGAIISNPEEFIAPEVDMETHT